MLTSFGLEYSSSSETTNFPEALHTLYSLGQTDGIHWTLTFVDLNVTFLEGENSWVYIFMTQKNVYFIMFDSLTKQKYDLDLIAFSTLEVGTVGGVK